MIKKPNPILFGRRTNEIRNKEKLTDFYPTPEHSVEEILEHIKLIEPILEPCNGLGNISKVVKKYYKDIKTFDINKEAIADEYLDFLEYNGDKFNTIITNPPFKYNYNGEFIKKSLDCINDNGIIVMLLKLVYLESNKRFEFFKEFPPKFIYVHSKRLNFYGGTGICYAWFVWQKGYKGDTILKII